MGYTCFICNKEVGQTSRQLIHHYRNIHGLNDRVGPIYCAEENCNQSYSYFCTLKKHLDKNHRDSLGPIHCLNPTVVISDEGRPQSREDLEVSGNELDNDLGNENENIEVNSEKEEDIVLDYDILKNIAVQFICQLKSSPSITTTTVQTVVSITKELIGEIVIYLKKIVKVNLNHIPKDDLENTLSKFEEVTNIFQCFDTEFLQIKFLKENGDLIMPRDIEINDNQPDGENETEEMKKFQLVPLKSMLKKVLESPGVFDLVKEYINSESDGFRDFKDGTQAKENGLQCDENKVLIPIMMYSDEFEVTNPLGSKTGIHKVTGFYYTIKGFPPKFNSCINNCYLLALCKSTYLKNEKMDSILSVIYEEFNDVETNGFIIDTPSYQGAVYAYLAQVSGDNLGLNSMLGLVEGFTANFMCRFCKIHRNEMVQKNTLDRNLLRTKDNYELDVAQNNSSETGIKRRCLLNELKHFHVVSNFVPDLMHDILEGIGPLELKLVLSNLVKNKFFTLDDLNSRISSFNYGPDRKDKPSAITKFMLANPDGATGQTASQSWCLLRYLPLIIGDVVPIEHEFYELLLMLLECIAGIFAPVIYQDNLPYLAQKISDHHEYFLSLFPERNLKPKHHLMLHYVDCIKMIGPLARVGVIRFEAKHNFFKQYARVICNFKNITKSLALRHQIRFAYNSRNTKALDRRATEVGACQNSLLANLNHGKEVAELLGVTLYEDVGCANWIKFNGVVYKPTFVVLLAIVDDDELPVFGKIEHIIIKGQQSCYFVVSLFKTLSFKRHFHAFHVTEAKPVKLILKIVEEIVDHSPLQSTACHNEDGCFIVPNDIIEKNGSSNASDEGIFLSENSSSTKWPNTNWTTPKKISTTPENSVTQEIKSMSNLCDMNTPTRKSPNNLSDMNSPTRKSPKNLRDMNTPTRKSPKNLRDMNTPTRKSPKNLRDMNTPTRKSPKNLRDMNTPTRKSPKNLRDMNTPTRKSPKNLRDMNTPTRKSPKNLRDMNTPTRKSPKNLRDMNTPTRKSPKKLRDMNTPGRKLPKKLSDMNTPSRKSPRKLFVMKTPTTKRCDMNTPPRMSPRKHHGLETTQNKSINFQDVNPASPKLPIVSPNRSSSIADITPETICLNANFNVKNFLLKHPQGKELCSSLSSRPVPLKTRRLLCRIMVSYLIENCVEYPSAQLKTQLAKQIVKEFPILDDSDKLGHLVWFAHGQKRPATGYLEERLRNVRKRLKKAFVGNIDIPQTSMDDPKTSTDVPTTTIDCSKTSMNCPTTSKGSLTLLCNPVVEIESYNEDEMEMMTDWLKENTCPYGQVKEYMRLTAPMRRKWIKDNPTLSVKDIFQMYPRLKDIPGMFELDFSLLYPKHCDNLIKNWTNYSGRIREHSLVELKDDVLRALHLNSDRDEEPTFDELENASFIALPYLVPSTTFKIGKRTIKPSKDDVKSSFIVNCQSGTINDYCENCKIPEPHIVTFGNEIRPTLCYIVIEKQAFHRSSILKAVDACFKMFYVLDLSYPTKCKRIWELIQDSFFKIGGERNMDVSNVIRSMRQWFHQEISDGCDS